MLRKILFYGAVAGLIVGAQGFAVGVMMSRHTPMPWAMAIGYLTMLIALSAVFVAVKRHRDIDMGGVIRFWPAFGLGLGISIVAGVIYVLSWETAVAVTHLDFAGEYTKSLIRQQQAAGVGGAALAKFVAEMEQFKLQYANPLWRLPMVFAEIFPVGVLVSAVSAGLLRNSRFLPVQRSVAS
jgi:Protein of unknown function (DUF4199)